MTKFAVAIASLFTNENTVEIIEADSIKNAVLGHSMVKSDSDLNDSVQELPDDLGEMVEDLYNGDLLLGVAEIK